MQEMWETWVQSLSQEDPLEEEIAIRSSILAWKIPWTEEPGGLQSIGSQRVGHDWVHTHTTTDTSQITALLQFHALETLAGYTERSINFVGKKRGMVGLSITKRSPAFDTGTYCLITYILLTADLPSQLRRISVTFTRIIVSTPCASCLQNTWVSGSEIRGQEGAQVI